jgi:hypothetical protein
MKPFISLKDLMLLLPVVTIGYALLYLLAVAYGHGPIPPASQLLDNLTLILWAWTTLFAVNFALAVSWTLRERREHRARLARRAARRAARR